MKNYVKFILKTYFFQNVFAFIDLFIDTIISVISSTQIACDVMCVQYVQKQPPEVFFEKDVIKNFANFTRKHLCWSLFFNRVTGQRACSFIKKRLQHRCVLVKLAKFYKQLLIKWYVINIITKNKSGVLHLNKIWFKREKDRLEKDTISASPK